MGYKTLAESSGIVGGALGKLRTAFSLFICILFAIASLRFLAGEHDAILYAIKGGTFLVGTFMLLWKGRFSLYADVMMIAIVFIYYLTASIATGSATAPIALFYVGVIYCVLLFGRWYTYPVALISMVLALLFHDFSMMSDITTKQTFAAHIISLILLVEILNIVGSDQRRLTQDLRNKVQELSQKNEELVSLSQAKNDFFASMSHELRTPLNAIIGFSEIIKQELFGSVPQKYRDYNTDIHKSGECLLNIVNSILDFSKMESGNLTLRYERVDLSDLISETIHPLHILADQKDIKLTNTSVTPIEVEVDRQLMSQAVTNIVANAIKFSPHGEITISNNVTDHTVTLSVKDQGIGLTEDEIQTAKNPYQQVGNNPYIANNQGTGLGLSICDRILALHGGSMELQSKPGEGTEVLLTFPIQRLAS